jgi:uncharacterized protein (DUF1501 family)
MQHASFISRRSFLQKTTMLAATAGLGRIGLINARAQTAPTGSSDYKALVCVFMLGGNDGHNMLVPLSGSALAAYKNARGSLALPDGNTAVLPVDAKNGTPYGLNGGLAALHPLWAQGKLAAVANMGMLVKPTTRAQYLGATVGLPTNLFSHSDQIISMQAGDPYGSGGSGWAGRVADATRAMNAAATFPPGISFAGSSLFCSANIVQSTSLIPGFNLSGDGMASWPASAATAKMKALQEIVTFNSGLSMVQAANDVRADGLELNGMLNGLGSSGVATVFPGTGIGQQLKQVAQLISLRGATGMKRQVFFCAINGFDTHSSQSWAQMDLLRDLADGMAAFYNATAEMGIADQVTTFTASEFGRSLQPSGTGTDHGWGNHHLIMGGAVRGGDLYGTFPDLSLGGPDDTGSRGVLIPTTSLDQFGGTCAKWFGVKPEDMESVFPNLDDNFTIKDLGFLV